MVKVITKNFTSNGSIEYNTVNWQQKEKEFRDSFFFFKWDGHNEMGKNGIFSLNFLILFIIER